MTVILGAYLLETSSLRAAKIIATVVLSVGGSLTASAISAYLINRFNDAGMRRAKLRAFFKVDDLSKQIAIVIPRFPYRAPGDSGNATNNPIGRCPEAVKDSRLTNKYSLAFDDIAAARHISAIFIELGVAPPRIEFDSDVWDSLFSTDGENRRLSHYKAFICVGLFSNEVTMEFATRTDERQQRYFKLSSRTEFYRSLRAVAICPYGPGPLSWLQTNPTDWDIKIEARLTDNPDTAEREPDFALIAKCLSPDGRQCLIVGGGRSRGTRKAGSYLRRNWESLYDHPGESRASKTRSNSFAAAFKLSGLQGARLQPNRHRLTDTPTDA